MSSWSRVAAVALLTVLAACGGGSGDTSEPSAAPVPDTGVPTSQAVVPPGCPDPDSSLSAGASTLDHAGLERSFDIYLPADYDGSARLPLVYLFHGFNSDAAIFAAYTDFPQVANDAGMIVIVPQGYGDPSRWEILGGPADDVGFITALNDVLTAGLCIDESAVFAAGSSNGSAFSVRLACSTDGLIEAVGLNAGMTPAIGCPEETDLSMIVFHGTDDPVASYEGGDQQIGDVVITLPTVEESLAGWARRAGCTEPPRREGSGVDGGGDVVTLSYDGCANGVAVELHAIQGGGHTWPGATLDVGALGYTTQEISASEAMVEFFLAR